MRRRNGATAWRGLAADCGEWGMDAKPIVAPKMYEIISPTLHVAGVSVAKPAGASWCGAAGHGWEGSLWCRGHPKPSSWLLLASSSWATQVVEILDPNLRQVGGQRAWPPEGKSLRNSTCRHSAPRLSCTCIHEACGRGGGRAARGTGLLFVQEGASRHQMGQSLRG